ncbi:MAG: exo-alpha-sialidase, partial [Ignavibacteriae bacterium]|nr:exo-alpha-sialidase [Ignavibacteriota bacterium]
MKFSVWILFFYLFIVQTFLVVAQDSLAEVFTYDLLSTSNNPRNSEGDFITLKDGRILFAYTRFVSSINDDGPAQIMGRFSTDGGKTWSEKDHLIVDREGEQNVMSVSFLRLQNDDIALFYLLNNSSADCIPVMRISKDEAQSWSEPQLVISDQKGYFVLNNDRVIQLKNGRLLVPVSLHKTPNSEWSNRGEIRCYFSDDNGNSWNRGQFVPIPEDVISQEPGVVELKGDRIMIYFRANYG